MPSLIINPYVTLDDKPIEIGQTYWTYELEVINNPVTVLEQVHRRYCVENCSDEQRNTYTIGGGILRAKCGCDGWVDVRSATGGRVALDGSRLYKNELVYMLQRVRG